MSDQPDPLTAPYFAACYESKTVQGKADCEQVGDARRTLAEALSDANQLHATKPERVSEVFVTLYHRPNGLPEALIDYDLAGKPQHVGGVAAGASVGFVAWVARVNQLLAEAGNDPIVEDFSTPEGYGAAVAAYDEEATAEEFALGSIVDVEGVVGNAPVWVKEVNWSYPTSDNAKTFGFAGVGCWTLSLHDRLGRASPQSVSGHKTERAALEAAFALPRPWSAVQHRYAAAELAASANADTPIIALPSAKPAAPGRVNSR